MATLQIPGKLVDSDSALDRQERIEKRRERVAAKIAKLKGEEKASTLTGGSSAQEIINAITLKKTKPIRKKQGTDPNSSSIRSVSSDGKPGLTDTHLTPQLVESGKELEQIIIDGNTLITNVKIAAEYREKTRTEHVEESRKERLQRLEKEAAESQEMYEQINQNWIQDVSKMLPLDLYNQIQEHKKQCDALLEKQDDEIYNLRRELEDQDIEYEQNLEMYQKDIMLMGDRIDDTVDTMRKAFTEELELIEEYTVHDREEILEENQRQWMNMLKEYEEVQKSSLEERKLDALEKFDRLTDLYGSVKQEVRLLKNQMQNDMRTLFVEREQLKGAIQVNLEKLDYNLSVLKKRQEENMKMKNSLKRLLLNLHERLNESTLQLKEKICYGRQKSVKLIREIRRMEVLCAEAKCKTLLLYSSDYKKFMDLWFFNEEECREKLCKLLGSERWIMEEQLGTEFNEPNLHVLEDRPGEVHSFKLYGFPKCAPSGKKSSVYSNQEYDNTVKTLKKPSDSGDSLADFEPDIKRNSAALIDKKVTASWQEEKKTLENSPCKRTSFKDDYCSEKLQFADKSPSLLIEATSEFEFCPGPDPDPLIQRQLMHHITKSICDQTGFLVEEKLRKIIEPMIDIERGLVHIDTVFEAIGVKNREEMQILARYLLRYSNVMKGLVSKIRTAEVPKSREMLVSETGVLEIQPVCNPPQCDDYGDSRIEKMIEQLKDDNYQSSSSSESLPGSALKENTLTPSAEAVVLDGLDPRPVVDPDESVEDESIVKVIHEFSSEESLADALDQVQKAKAFLDGTEQNKKEMAATNADTSCSCPKDDDTTCCHTSTEADSFASNRATVMSWVTDVACGKMPQVFSTDGLAPEDAPPEDAGGQFKTFSQLMTSPCPPLSLYSASYGSSTSADTIEFLYIEPNDVLRAIAAYCRDYNEKNKREYPTKSQICDTKISLIKFPSEAAIQEYWNKYIGFVDSNHDVLWDAIQDVFTQYNVNLKVRNQYVEDVVKYYKQNLELSQILKRHMESFQWCSSIAGPFQPLKMPTCVPASPSTVSPIYTKRSEIDGTSSGINRAHSRN